MSGVVIGVLGVLNLVQLWISYNLLNKILIQAKVGPLLAEKPALISDIELAPQKRGKIAFSLPVTD